MAGEQDRYREVIGRFTTGVCVVTCEGPSGPAGLTTNAVTSVSLEPLLLLVCFDNASRTLPAVREARPLRRQRAARGTGGAGARLRVEARRAREVRLGHAHRRARRPVLDGALAWLACDLRELLPAGDHTIGIGAVTQMDAEPTVGRWCGSRAATQRSPEAARSGQVCGLPCAGQS